MGGDLEFVAVPSQLAGSALIEVLPPGARPHVLLDSKAKRDHSGR